MIELRKNRNNPDSTTLYGYKDNFYISLKKEETEEGFSNYILSIGTNIEFYNNMNIHIFTGLVKDLLIMKYFDKCCLALGRVYEYECESPKEIYDDDNVNIKQDILVHMHHKDEEFAQDVIEDIIKYLVDYATWGNILTQTEPVEYNEVEENNSEEIIGKGKKENMNGSTVYYIYSYNERLDRYELSCGYKFNNPDSINMERLDTCIEEFLKYRIPWASVISTDGIYCDECYDEDYFRKEMIEAYDSDVNYAIHFNLTSAEAVDEILEHIPDVFELINDIIKG